MAVPRALWCAALFAVLGAALPWRGIVAQPTTSTGGTGRGTVLKMSMAAPSMGEPSRNVRVYLPPSYDDPAAAHRRYPVVYMLHGWPGSEGNLLSYGHADRIADSLIARGAIPEIIMVFPNGNGAGTLGRSFWINSEDGRKRVEDYVTRDVVDWTDRTFRTRPFASARGVIGISEGADGGFNMVFQHPDVFSACGGHSGDYRVMQGFGTRGFLGDGEDAERQIERNSPALYANRIAPQLRSQTLYFDCGTEDESLQHSREMDRLLTSLGVPHVYREYPGSHTWGYWRQHLPESLIAVAGALRQSPASYPYESAGAAHALGAEEREARSP